MSNFIRMLQKREINWCEGGFGYPASCPGPSDPPENKYCCSFPYLGGSYKGSCCQYPVHEGVLISSCLACIIIFALLMWLYCWCWPTSWMNKKKQRTAPSAMISQDEMFPRRNSFKNSIPID